MPVSYYYYMCVLILLCVLTLCVYASIRTHISQYVNPTHIGYYYYMMQYGDIHVHTHSSMATDMYTHTVACRHIQ
jgi:hypothetical protein